MVFPTRGGDFLIFLRRGKTFYIIVPPAHVELTARMTGVCSFSAFSMAAFVTGGCE